MINIKPLGRKILKEEIPYQFKEAYKKSDEYRYFNFDSNKVKKSIPPFTQFLNLDLITSLNETNLNELFSGVENILIIDIAKNDVYSNFNIQSTKMTNLVLYTNDFHQLNNFLIIKNFKLISKLTMSLTNNKDLTNLKKHLVKLGCKIVMSTNWIAQDVGNSDNEDKTDNIKRKFTLSNPLSAKHTTIWCRDGAIIKGDALIYNCHNIILKKFYEFHEYEDLISSNDDFTKSTKMEDVNTDKDVIYCEDEDSNVLRDLGNHIYEYSTVSEVSVADKEITKTIRFRSSKAVFELIQPVANNGNLIATSRLYLISNNSILGCVITKDGKADLTYAQIALVNQHIILFLNKLGKESPNELLATLQLTRLRDTEHGEQKLDLTFINNKKYEDELLVWLDYLNVLMFRVEASRINTSIITGLMVLQLIEAGNMTYKEAFADSSEYGGQYPGASLKTGSGNFKARANLLSFEGSYGLQNDRQYPQWLALTLKEAIVMINWLKMIYANDEADFNNASREEVIKDFRVNVQVMIQDYLQVVGEI